MLYFEHKWINSTLATSFRWTRHKNRILPSGLRSSRVWRLAFGVKSAKSFFLDYVTSYLVGLIGKGQAILERSFETFRTTHTITHQHIPHDLSYAALRAVIRLRFTTEARVQFRPHDICCGPSGTGTWFFSRIRGLLEKYPTVFFYANTWWIII